MSEFDSGTPAAPARPLPRHRQWQAVGAALLVVLVLFVIVPAISHALFPPPAETRSKPDDGTFAASQKEWATLRFETVQPRNFADRVVTDGRIALDDDHTTPIYSPVTGRVTHIFVKPGDRIRAGSPLFAVLASEFVQARSDLVAAQAGLATARAQLKLAQDAEARQHDLFTHQGAAFKDWQQAQVDLATAQAGLRNAQAAAAAVSGRLHILGADARDIAALERDALAGHGEAETIVRAPVAGTVTQRLIGVGQYLGSIAGGGNATQAFTISDLSQVWVVGNLREEDAMRAHVGQSAEVRLLVQPKAVIHARVDYVAPALDPASRRLTVRAVIDNPGGRLKPEMFANFVLLTGDRRMNLAVPTASVIYEGSAARVWVARADRHLALREVTTGVTVDGYVEVRAGLKAGDRVVTAGSLFIDRGAQTD